MRVTDGNTALDLQLAQKLKQTGDNGGINCMGYGLISKYALTDPELPTGSKGLYACVCSTADSKTRVAHTNPKKIKKEFGISENKFYKDLKPLTEQGYIIKTIVNGKVVYTIADKPSKFFEKPKDQKLTEKYANIRKYGLFDKDKRGGGFGSISRAVMSDTRLNRVEKLNYAELCAFAGKNGKYGVKFADKGRTAQLKLKYMLFHIGICMTTYYKYKNLIKYNYITVFKLHKNGRFKDNIYLLNDRPDMDNVSDEPVILVETDKPKVNKNQRHADYNRNRKNKQRDFERSPAAGTPTPTEIIKPVPKLSKRAKISLEQLLENREFDAYLAIMNETGNSLRENGGFDFRYIRSRKYSAAVVHYLTYYAYSPYLKDDTAFKTTVGGFKNISADKEVEKTAFKALVAALTGIISSKNNERYIERLNALICDVRIRDRWEFAEKVFDKRFVKTAVESYINGHFINELKHNAIEKPIAYMRECILDVLDNMEIAEQSGG